MSFRLVRSEGRMGCSQPGWRRKGDYSILVAGRNMTYTGIKGSHCRKKWAVGEGSRRLTGPDYTRCSVLTPSFQCLLHRVLDWFLWRRWGHCMFCFPFCSFRERRLDGVKGYSRCSVNKLSGCNENWDWRNTLVSMRGLTQFGESFSQRL